MRAALDAGLARLMSRKLLAFGVASGALFAGALTSGDWAAVAVAYVGSQGFVDVVERIYRSRGGG